MERYEAAEMPRGNLVVKITDGDRQNMEVVDTFPTLELAERCANELNLDAWLAERPQDLPPMTWGDDWEVRLMQIIEKPYPDLVAA